MVNQLPSALFVGLFKSPTLIQTGKEKLAPYHPLSGIETCWQPGCRHLSVPDQVGKKQE
jgi:hypothetical protein